jgi:predicted 3-demethylubiquinone-9 3-methyltransferase (glyoxalase superfamily)
MQKIMPFLWFDANAEEAMRFYTAVFPDSKILKISRYGDAGPGPTGSVMTAVFEIAGQTFIALNGGPQHTFTPAISFVVNCESQAEIDTYWSRLSEGGRTDQCGWLRDRFGLSWQIVPTALGELLSGPDPERAQRVMQAMLGMRKLDIAGLRRAAEQ